MDKTILQEYIDACELVKDIEAEIQKLSFGGLFGAVFTTLFEGAFGLK